MNIELTSDITEQILKGIQKIHSVSREELDYRNDDTFLIATDGNEFLGYAHSRFSCCTLLALYVVQKHRKSRKKVGSSLLLRTLEELKNCSVNRLQAGIEPNNKKVISFYEKHGFSKTSIGKTGFTTITYDVRLLYT